MGASSSHFFLYAKDFAKFQPCIDAIEKESHVEVYEKYFASKFKTAREMMAVGALTFEKAIDNPGLSPKCTQLLQLLQKESAFTGGRKEYFYGTFGSLFIPYMKRLLKKFDRNSKMISKQRGIAIASYISTLYRVEFITKHTMIEMLHNVLSRESPKNAFFMNILKSAVDENELITELLLGGFQWDSESDVDDSSDAADTSSDSSSIIESDSSDDLTEVEHSMEKFRAFVKNIHTGTNQTFFDGYEDFRDLSVGLLGKEVEGLWIEATSYENNTSVYRNVFLEIYQRRPSFLVGKLQYEIRLLLSHLQMQYEITGVNRDYGGIEEAGILVGDFYNLGMIDEDVIEKFLDVTTLSKSAAYFRLFMDMLRRYNGNRLEYFFCILKEKTRASIISKPVMSAVQHFIEGTSVKSVGDQT